MYIDPEIAQAKIAVLGLAVRTHESGLADDGATVVESAERFWAFVEDGA
ncbi:hypothetical protein FGG44_gp01 [Mycobacterium phage MacnCheese]|uniref:Gene 1 ring forming protein domain-containing protein n=1 Tax=Mycobacterium phage MacnCheese TaxID=2927982 RepID=I6XD72_9CAUD|nr:hypothetical protein FGG44_gp01 [Mycobacterium phage MacnCheese]AFN37791.1 hypothetical protein MACNCHEESE_1 [Mycobacterium phage MacnCheese]